MANTKVTVEQAIKNGEAIVYKVPHPGYDRGNRLGPDSYDCSGFMATIWGLVDIYKVAPTTGLMVEEYQKYGFDHYSFGSVTLQKGDILVNPTDAVEGIGHTAMVYDDGVTQLIESHGGYGPDIRGIWGLNDFWVGQHVLRGSGGFYIDKWLPTDGSRGFHH